MIHPDYRLQNALQNYAQIGRAIRLIERHPSRLRNDRPYGVLYWDLQTSARDLRELALHLINTEGAMP